MASVFAVACVTKEEEQNPTQAPESIDSQKVAADSPKPDLFDIVKVDAKEFRQKIAAITVQDSFKRNGYYYGHVWTEEYMTDEYADGLFSRIDSQCKPHVTMVETFDSYKVILLEARHPQLANQFDSYKACVKNHQAKENVPLFWLQLFTESFAYQEFNSKNDVRSAINNAKKDGVISFSELDKILVLLNKHEEVANQKRLATQPKVIKKSQEELFEIL